MASAVPLLERLLLCRIVVCDGFPARAAADRRIRVSAEQSDADFFAMRTAFKNLQIEDLDIGVPIAVQYRAYAQTL
jgi:hypothetical protein